MPKMVSSDTMPAGISARDFIVNAVRINVAIARNPAIKSVSGLKRPPMAR